MDNIQVEQGTQEWRDGRWLTASNAHIIKVSGKGLETLVYDICAEKLSSHAYEGFTNEHTERGNTLEDEARALYELESNSIVEQVGFVKLSEYVGCSPDGLVANDGLVEFKCPADKGYVKTFFTNEFDSQYYWQVQMQMYVTGRQWCDLVFYNPNLSKPIKTFRIERNNDDIEKIEAGLVVGELLIKQVLGTFDALLTE